MEEKLIELVKTEELLYNKRNQHYKNIFLRNKKFDEFGKELNIPAKKLKQRWRSLRDTFFKELKRNRALSGCGSSITKKKWRYMDQMMFLKDSLLENKETTGKFEFEEMIETDMFSSYNDHDPPNANILDTSEPECSFLEADSVLSNSTFDKKIKTEDLLATTNANFFELVNTAKAAFGCPPAKPKNFKELFFESICKQVEAANITPHEYGLLQIEILQSVNKYINKNNS